MAPRWEDETFALGNRVAIIGADGSIRYASCDAELVETPLPARKEPFARWEWHRIDEIFRTHDAKTRPREAA